MNDLYWSSKIKIPSKKYICGFCGNLIASDFGFEGFYKYMEGTQKKSVKTYIYLCHMCNQPTFFGFGDKQYPGISFGNVVQNLPDQVESLYNEARQCCSVSAYTGAVLCSRKLIMNIAVNQGASAGQKFIQYVDYLSNKGFIPPNGKDWVDHIRSKGNEATHEIPDMKAEDAELLLMFIEMLLKFIYEYPEMIKSR